MKTILNERFKRVQGTFKITEKQLITSRYLQITLERAEGSSLEALEVGGRVKIRPQSKEEANNYKRDRKTLKLSPFLITNVDSDSGRITIEALSATEENPFFEKIMCEVSQTVCLKSKGDKGEHKGKHKKHKYAHIHHGKQEHSHHGKHKHHQEGMNEEKPVFSYLKKHHVHKKKHHSFHEDHISGQHNHHRQSHM